MDIKKQPNLFNLFNKRLESGVVWVDKGMKSACHYYDPDNGTGMWMLPSAAEKCAGFFYKSLGLWQRKKHAMSMFFLGAAIHLVQDVCVPHHAACKMFNNHLDYEHWAEKRKGNYLADSKGVYGISNKPEEWIMENARVAKKYYHMVEKGTKGGYHMATAELLTRAQITTAGFLLNYFCQL